MLDRRWIDGYLAHLARERRLSPHTSSNYARDVGALADYLERGNVTDWKRVDSQHVRMFAARAHAGGLSPRSVQRRLSAVRGYFNYLVREGVAASNPAVEIRAPKAARRLPGTLDVDQITQLLEAPTGDALAVRDRAIMELFYSSGLRLAELVGLGLTDVDLVDRTARVLGKGAKTRIVPVGRKACEAIRPGCANAAHSPGSTRLPCSWAATATGSSRAPCSCASPTGRGARGCRAVSIRTCSGIRSRRICLNRVRICVVSRSCSATPTSPPPRSTLTLISPTWPAPTTLPTLGQNASRRSPCQKLSTRTARPSSPCGGTALSPSAATARSRSATR
jgi:integrase